ncbi:MAG: hypothetical protein F6K42_04130 [Leptolyngbya sp. SIO1D8]|nr:hypothetical protein [Leptolyngbya sp. SIO1D8]
MTYGVSKAKQEFRERGCIDGYGPVDQLKTEVRDSAIAPSHGTTII